MPKPLGVFRVADPGTGTLAMQDSDWHRVEARAKDLARRHRRWTEVMLEDGTLLAEVSPDGMVNLTMAGCDYA